MQDPEARTKSLLQTVCSEHVRQDRIEVNSLTTSKHDSNKHLELPRRVCVLTTNYCKAEESS